MERKDTLGKTGHTGKKRVKLGNMVHNQKKSRTWNNGSDLEKRVALEIMCHI